MARKVTKKTCKHPKLADVVAIVVRILISAEARIGMLHNCKTQQGAVVSKWKSFIFMEFL